VLLGCIEDDRITRQRDRGSADGHAVAAAAALLGRQRKHTCDDEHENESNARHPVSIDDHLASPRRF